MPHQREARNRDRSLTLAGKQSREAPARGTGSLPTVVSSRPHLSVLLRFVSLLCFSLGLSPPACPCDTDCQTYCLDFFISQRRQFQHLPADHFSFLVGDPFPSRCASR